MKSADFYFKSAAIYGTAALLWTVPSLNIFGIIGLVLSWKAYKRNDSNIALKAGTLYVVAAAVSVIFALILFFLGIMILDNGSSFILASSAAAISIVGDILYITASIMSSKGEKAYNDLDTKVSS